MKTFIGIIAIFVVLASASGLRTFVPSYIWSSSQAESQHLNSLVTGISSLPELDSYKSLLKYIPQIGEWNACFVNSPWQKVVNNALTILNCTNIDEAETWSKISDRLSQRISYVRSIDISDYCITDDFECVVKTLAVQVQDIPLEISAVLKADVKCLDSSIKKSLSSAKAAAENIAECLCKAGFPCK